MLVKNSHFIHLRKLSQHLSIRPSSSNAHVRIVEVGPRDGLQNVATNVPTDVKIEFINKLSETGLQTIEVTSFVSAKWVPQMSDNAKVFTQIRKNPAISYPALVPNVKGLEAAIKVGVKEVAVFTSSSESFHRKNNNCSINEGITRIRDIVRQAKQNGVKVRGYVSCVVGCPYDGYVKPTAVTRVCEDLLNLGCYEISLGDTIGVGTRSTIEAMIKDLVKITTPDRLAIHCHDTYGQALVNICTVLDLGVQVVDSSSSGLGGCPYAMGATGNVATEDLVYMLHGMGVETGVDLKKLIEAGHYISEKLNKPSDSKVNNALYRKYF